MNRDIEDMTQVIVLDKTTGEAEVTYIEGQMYLEHLDGRFAVYISAPGYHKNEAEFKVVLKLNVEGHAKRTGVPDTDPENKKKED